MTRICRLTARLIGLCVLLSGVACGGSSSNSSGGAGGSSNAAAETNLNRDPTLFGSGENFVNFESGQVRPLALSTDGNRLYATNTPNSTLDIFAVTDSGLALLHSLPVGLEPVAVGLRSDAEAWVVNHLSDSVSVINVAADPPVLEKTLLVGDEPRDIVFAGEDRQYAFISAAHRGQNGPDDTPIDARVLQAGVNRADVWVFDAGASGESLGGDPLTVLSMFGDTLRSLAVGDDGNRVYAAVMNSGNRTTAVGENRLAKPGPQQSSDGNTQPDTGLIVQFDGSDWLDETGSATDLNNRSYNSLVPFTLPDYDVFTIDASAIPQVIGRQSGVGTTLFNMVENPLSGVLYVSNTEALNVNRFEGQGLAASSIRGNFARSRISLIDGQQVVARDLNHHLDRSQRLATDAQRRLSVAQPMGLAISANGESLYVAGFASAKIAVYNTDELANGSFEVSAAQQITLDDGGPTGLALDEARGRLYALTRFSNRIAIVDTLSRNQLQSVQLFNPEPVSVIAGRPFLYDATQTSSHGDSACGLCHVFGDTDALAWDLGNPDAAVVNNPNVFVNRFLAPDDAAVFHPMKGPMTTQSLRGLAEAGPMHWRGDRSGQSAAPEESLERAAFREFNVAFPELLGRQSEIADAQMQQFAEFALTLSYPPNPIRALDNSLSSSQENGRDVYMNKPTTGNAFRCNDCHTLDPANGHFGTSGASSIEGSDISQEFKVPHLRNMYQKVGKFGNSGRFSATDAAFGEQIRGFGFMHDGNMDTLDNFFKGDVFRFDPDPQVNDRQRLEVIDFVMAIDSNMAPIVGQQVTLTPRSRADSEARLALLMARAMVSEPLPECDLVARANLNDRTQGFLLQSDGTFAADTGDTFSAQQLRQLAQQPDGAVTYTCVPPGSGRWLGIDRNQDGVLDGQSE